MKRDYLKGLKHGLAIAIGYFAVSFSFGILALQKGLSWFSATIISMTNLTSAGQFAGLTVIVTGTGILGMITSQLVINSRYALMSFSLSQKLASSLSPLQRAVIAFSNTDEIFAVAMAQQGKLSFSYMLGLATLPWIGWSSGTLIGALAGEILPEMVSTALGISLYGMLISIVMPNVRDKKSVRVVALIALVFSCAFTYVPYLNKLDFGFSIVVCTIVAASIGALFFPVEEETK